MKIKTFLNGTDADINAYLDTLIGKITVETFICGYDTTDNRLTHTERKYDILTRVTSSY